MIVRTLGEVQGTNADVRTESWRSTRFLLRADNMGFTITETVVEAGMDETLWYKHHLEACLCIEGEANLTDLATGKEFVIVPGTLYALDKHDRHRIVALERTRLICVFSPALTGSEVHGSDGSYSLPG